MYSISIFLNLREPISDFANSNGVNLPVLDIILGVILAFGLIRGLMKGFIVEIASLIALVLGIYGAIHFSYYLVDILDQYLSWSEAYLNLTALILTFIIIVVAISILAKIFTKLTKLVALNLLNRLLGGIFGLLKMTLILSILLMFFKSFNSEYKLMEQEMLKNSILYQPIEKFGTKILPSVLNEIKSHSDWNMIDKEGAKFF